MGYARIFGFIARSRNGEVVSNHYCYINEQEESLLDTLDNAFYFNRADNRAVRPTFDKSKDGYIAMEGNALTSYEFWDFKKFLKMLKTSALNELEARESVEKEITARKALNAKLTEDRESFAENSEVYRKLSSIIDENKEWNNRRQKLLDENKENTIDLHRELIIRECLKDSGLTIEPYCYAN